MRSKINFQSEFEAWFASARYWWNYHRYHTFLKIESTGIQKCWELKGWEDIYFFTVILKESKLFGNETNLGFKYSSIDFYTFLIQNLQGDTWS